jgi:hypothetical protein
MLECPRYLVAATIHIRWSGGGERPRAGPHRSGDRLNAGPTGPNTVRRGR